MKQFSLFDEAPVKRTAPAPSPLAEATAGSAAPAEAAEHIKATLSANNGPIILEK